MGDRVTEYVRSAEGVVGYIDELLGTCRRFKKAVSKQAKRISAGTPAVEALESVDGASIREELVAALDHFEALRHQMRLTFVALAQEEGASLAEVARALGVSRQLVHRVARDID